jgi:hypothetical protein
MAKSKIGNHSFKKHPSKHKDKKVKSAFKLGMKTGYNKAKKKYK